MIGLAVGIDYALFIVSRHRGQLSRGMAPAESVAQSLATAGSAVIFAGATVVIALCGLVVAQIPFLAVMGYAAAVAVAVAVAVALTVVPAMLGLAGERLRPKPGSRASRNAVVEPGQTHTFGAKLGRAWSPSCRPLTSAGGDRRARWCWPGPPATSRSACPTTARRTRARASGRRTT